MKQRSGGIGFTVALLPVLFCAAAAFAGGGPQNVLVVVNDADAESLEIGTYYAAARGIDPGQVFHVDLPVATEISTNDFEVLVRQPIATYLADTGLDAQVDFLVFAFDRPYRVQASGGNINGLTAAAYCGYRDAPTSPTCNLNPLAANEYFARDEAFTHDAAFLPEDRRLAVMLAGDNVGEIRGFIDRSVAADGTRPGGDVFLLRTTDSARNVQWPQFEDAIFDGRLLDAGQTWHFLESNEITGETNVAGYTVGRSSVLASLFSNTFVPGAIADSLTSYGGRLHNTSGQMSIVEWLRAGCAGSYGTVVEPCNYTNKFVHARVHAHYARGYNLAESYGMAVHSPYQGLTIGDPLCAPYALPPGVQITAPTPDAAVTGTIPVDISATSADANRWIDRIDLFVDDRFHATAWEAGPTPGNQVTVTVDARSKTVTVQAGDDLADIAADLAAVMNANSPASQRLSVTADAGPDRVSFRQPDSTLGSADTRSCAVAVAQGGGAMLSVNAWVASPALMETTFPARRAFVISGVPDAGDTLTMIIRRVDGVRATSVVTAVAGDTHITLLNAMAAAIADDPVLQAAEGCRVKYSRHLTSSPYSDAFVVARTPGWESYNIEATWVVTGTGLDDTSYSARNFDSNADVLGSRGEVFLAAGSAAPSVSYPLDTTAFADGPHVLRAVAYSGTAVAAQGHALVPVIVDNHVVACEVAVPAAGSTWVQGASVPAEATAASDQPIAELVLEIEGKVFATVAGGSLSTNWPSAGYGVGLVVIRARATDTLGRSTVSDPVEVAILPDYDGDGIDDDWEREHYTPIELYAKSDDPDGDGKSTGFEYIADTDPLDPASRLAIDLTLVEPDSVPRLRFPTSSRRRYAIEYNDAGMTAPGSWTAVHPDLFPGIDAILTWDDDGADVAPPTGPRTYRIDVFRP